MLGGRTGNGRLGGARGWILGWVTGCPGTGQLLGSRLGGCSGGCRRPQLEVDGSPPVSPAGIAGSTDLHSARSTKDSQPQKETETTDPRRSRSTPTSCISSSCRRFTALSCDCKLVMSCRSCPSPGIKAGSATVVLTTSRFSPSPEAEGGIIRRAVGKSVGWSKSEICREGSQF